MPLIATQPSGPSSATSRLTRGSASIRSTRAANRSDGRRTIVPSQWKRDEVRCGAPAGRSSPGPRWPRRVRNASCRDVSGDGDGGRRVPRAGGARRRPPPARPARSSGRRSRRTDGGSGSARRERHSTRGGLGGREQRSAHDRRTGRPAGRRHDGLTRELAKEGPPLDRRGLRPSTRASDPGSARVGVVDRLRSSGRLVAHVARNLAGEPPTCKARRAVRPGPPIRLEAPDHRVTVRPQEDPRDIPAAGPIAQRIGGGDSNEQGGSVRRTGAARCGGTPTRPA